MPYYVFWDETIFTNAFKCIDSKRFIQIDDLNFLNKYFSKRRVNRLKLNVYTNFKKIIFGELN